MARWKIEKVAKSKTPQVLVSRAVGDKSVAMGKVDGGVHEALVDIVAQMEAGDFVETPEGFAVMVKPQQTVRA